MLGVNREFGSVWASKAAGQNRCKRRAGDSERRRYV